MLIVFALEKLPPYVPCDLRVHPLLSADHARILGQLHLVHSTYIRESPGRDVVALDMAFLFDLLPEGVKHVILGVLKDPSRLLSYYGGTLAPLLSLLLLLAMVVFPILQAERAVSEFSRESLH